ncbi:hypothetical protein OSB04_016016 [Centaurea solstitialis]|uniref:Uncharacterized protein n=1 Tax=Centaurea solstitialis TaxID=347529 RepID=A0AA38TDE3_9ASTR|nr:hypothetical protein OSB04_016016 [Centaurea solstitialis]
MGSKKRSSDSAVKPMERKKKRKALDKEKHCSSLDDDNGEFKPKVVELEVKEVVESRSVNSLPEFRIGVFKDLGSADVSVREAAAERLGMELQECARQGFALGLTLLVGTVPDIALSSLLKLIVDLLEVSSSMKGQEIKDCLLGRVFAYGSLARSGRLIQESVSDESSELIKEFTSSVISLATKKRYLQDPAVVVVLQLVEKLPIEVVLKQVPEAPGLQEWFEGATEAGNPDALLLALKLREKISADNQIFGKLLPHPYSPGLMFSADHLSSLSNCLMVISIVRFVESTFSQPRVHGVWPVLVNILLPDIVPEHADSAAGLSSTKKHKKNRKSSSHDEDIQKNLQSFWEIIY